MKKQIIMLASLAWAPTVFSQDHGRLTDQEAGSYYEWFQSYSNSSELYSDRSTLYIYNKETNLYNEPCVESEVLHNLKAGDSIQNRAYGGEDFIPSSEIRGYHDMWYQVVVYQQDGRAIRGYVWGGDIAKAWLYADINQDNERELLLLGVSEKPRRTLRDIRAGIKVLQNQEEIDRRELSGMCLFEECKTDAMLRIFKDTQRPELVFLEAGSMTISCASGIERAFFIWKGDGLECVYYGAFSASQVYEQEPFMIRTAAEKASAKVCRFAGIGPDFNPVWICREEKRTTSDGV